MLTQVISDSSVERAFTLQNWRTKPDFLQELSTLSQGPLQPVNCSLLTWKLGQLNSDQVALYLRRQSPNLESLASLARGALAD
jgi:hypothetical protein